MAAARSEDGDNLSSPRPQILCMEFQVHVGVKFDGSVDGYSGGRVSYMRFMEPQGVDWFVMQENLVYHGYEGNATLYYLKPGHTAPQGLVLMDSAEHVQQLMKDHQGLKVCKLFILGTEEGDSDVWEGEERASIGVPTSSQPNSSTFEGSSQYNLAPFEGPDYMNNDEDIGVCQNIEGRAGIRPQKVVLNKEKDWLTYYLSYC